MRGMKSVLLTSIAVSIGCAEPAERSFIGDYGGHPGELAEGEARPWTSGRRLAVHEGALYAVDRDAEALLIFDAETLEKTRTVELPGIPEQVVVAPDGVAFVAMRQAGGVAIVGAAGVEAIDLGGDAAAIALNNDATTLYVVLLDLAQLVEIDVASRAIVTRRPTNERPAAVAVSRDGGVVVGHETASPWRLSAEGQGTWGPLRTRTPEERRDGFASGLVVQDLNAAGNRALVASPSDHTVFAGHNRALSGVMQQCFSYYGHTTCTTLGAPERTISGMVTPVGRDMPSEGLSMADGGVIEYFTAVVDVNHHPTRPWLFVTDLATDRVGVLDTRFGDPMISTVGLVATGRGPRSVAFSSDGAVAYVLTEHDREVERVALAPLFDADFVVGLEASDRVSLGADPLSADLREGASMFSNANDARIAVNRTFACVSCHFEGRDDGRVWRTQYGNRQTPVLAHRMEATAPFGWNGQHDTLPEYVRAAVERMGGSGLAAVDEPKLLAYLRDGLAIVDSASSATASVVRGRQLFESPELGCSTCHPAGLTTGINDKNPLAGFGGDAFDTPPLIGLRYSAPYLHDGSAADLFAVLELTEDWMGNTAALTTDERVDLVAYLLTL